MRHTCTFAAVPLLALSMTGCGPESTSGSNFRNPAASVSLSYESFELKNESGMPGILPQTIFYDFYRGLEPADGEDDEGVAAALRERLDLLMGLERTDDNDSAYSSARNPLDLLHHVISSNEVNTFNQGRRLMRDSLTEEEGARYNTPDRNALIRFTENGNSNDEEPGPDQVWVYNLLDWTSNPQLDNVYRAAQFIAQEPEDDDTNPPEVESAIWSGQFNGADFSVSGYNRPEFAATSLTGRSLGNVEFWQEYIDNRSDTLILNGTEITINGEEADYVCAELDYTTSTIKVYTEARDDATPEEEEEPELALSPVDCEQQGAGDPIEYTTVAIPERQ